MTNQFLISSYLKIERAKQHFKQLRAEIQQFIGRNPYTAIVDFDSEPAIQIHRLRISEPVPPQLSPIIGDLLHNLMGALDSLATQIVVVKGYTSEEILRQTYFPIHWRKEDLSSNQQTQNFFERADAAVEKLVRRIQPYGGGRGDFLLRLKNLDITDKHRAIIPVISSVAQITFHTLLPDGVSVTPPRLGHNLRDGDELLRTAFWEPHFEARTNFEFHLGIDQDMPLLDRVGGFIYLVERVIKLFERESFQKSL